MAGGGAFVAILQRLGGAVEVGNRQGTVDGAFTGTDGKAFYPFHLRKDGAAVSLSVMWLQTRPRLQDDAARKRLLESLAGIVGPLTTANLKGLPSFRVALLAEPEMASRVEEWLAGALNEMR